MELTRSLTDRLGIFKQLLAQVMQSLPKNPKVIDLGCGHCLFMDAAKNYGCDVYGIDAREDRVPKEIRDSGRFKKEDVRHADLSDYDLILCLGIFYHLTFEDQKILIEKFRGKTVILDTHYGNLRTDAYTHVNYGDVGGILFDEELSATTAAFKNITSFWPYEDDLIELLIVTHFVLKCLPEHHPGRSFYLLTPYR